MGAQRLVLPAAVHVLCVAAAVELALMESSEWRFVGIVLLAAAVSSAIGESIRALREYGTRHELGLSLGGITVDAVVYRAQRAWLGPWWTSVWLTASGRRRRLLSIWRGEVTDADYAALRRHMQALDFTV